MLRALRLALGFVAVVALVGCDDDPETNCNYVLNPCETLGDVRCAEDGTGVEECGQNSDGCLLWNDEDLCDDFEVCSDASGEPECVCDNGCDAEGDTQCADDVVQVCAVDRDGCFYWDDEEDCSETSMTCEVLDGAALCSGCSNECETEDDSQCEGEVIQTCEVGADGCLEWVDGTDCASLVPVQFCDDTDDAALCTNECVDRCLAADDTQCDGEIIETCEVIASGCLDWVAGTDCSTLEPPTTCDDTGGSASCIGTCEDQCPVAEEQRCVAGVIESCAEAADGCLDWVAGDDCSAMDPPAICVERDAAVECVDPGSSESCADAIVIATPFVIEGEEFNMDFDDDQELRGDGCYFFTDSPEAVFAVDLVAGDRLRVTELAGMEAVISIQEVCGDTEVCAASNNWDVYYHAVADIRVYVVVEGTENWWGEWDYEIRIDVAQPEVCDNGFDDDFDWSIDCRDEDCVSEPACDVEADCENWFDDDHDGLLDCADPDCDAADRCIPEEDCDDNIDNDIDGARDCDDPGCIGEPPCDVENFCDDWWDNDGDGLIDCMDTDCDEETVCLPESDCADGDDNDSDWMWDCDDPGCMGEPACDVETNCSDGWDNDHDGMRDCDDVDCEAEPLCDEETECGDDVDNDDDGSVDCADWDCFGVEPCVVETICDDWNDNDRDGVWDCEDPDCATICVPETECDDGEDNDNDWYWDCEDPDCFGMPPCDTETNCWDRRDNDLDGYVDCNDSDCGEMLDCIRETDCDDGIDNDDNGWIDCADWDCFGVPPCDVETICNDWNDNDRDGAWDCEDTDCAGDAHCLPEADCGDGEDNDTDGWIDCQDRDCFGADPYCSTEEFCRDSWDNDDDGLMDCDDPDCADEVHCIPETECGDFEDNDEDGWVDCQDDDCFGRAPDCTTEVYCWDGRDNDGDGMVDCDDPECATNPECLREENCGDGIDDEPDGWIDCADPDCFGVVPHCTTESVCGDWYDNDLDALVDCDDPDCLGSPDCVPAHGVWEYYQGAGAGDAIDLEGSIITFSPNATLPNGYAWTTTSGITGFLVDPGTGDTSTTLDLGDDEVMEHTFEYMEGFEFYGVSYASVYVVSNGYLTFGSTDVAYWNSPLSVCFEHPSVMGLRGDINPDLGGTITLDEFDDRLAVTFEGIAGYFDDPTTDPNHFQMVLYETGDIELIYVELNIENYDIAVGIGDGLGRLTPDEFDFIP